MRIGLIDIENSHFLAALFSLYPEAVGHENIQEEWHLFCAAWKVLGETKVHSASLLDDKKRFKKDPSCDRHVVEKLCEFVASCDVIVGHNAVKFDIPKLKTRAAFHGLPPLPPVRIIDTLQVARKEFAFTSNRLDYISKYLGGEGKKTTSPGLWLRALRGDPKAIREMVAYNIVDIEELEYVFLKLRPWIKNYPNQNVTGNTAKCCPTCSSSKVEKRGLSHTNTSSRQRYRCKSCGSWSQGEIVQKIERVVLK